MIFNYDGKSYDTVDGQEQPYVESARKPADGERLEIDRWVDDGASGRSPASILKGMVCRVIGARRVRSSAPAAAHSSLRVASPSGSAAERRRAFYRNPWENT